MLFCFSVLIKSSHQKKIQLECDVEKSQPKDLCYHKPITITTKNVELSSKGHNHGITKLLFLGDTITFLPKKIAVVFPDLISLKVGPSHLVNITKDDFKGLDKLTSLILWGNEIEEIQPDTFSDLLQLEELNLGFNKIKLIEQGLFLQNIKLKNIKLNMNQIEEIHPDIIKHLKNLEKLSLAANKCIEKNYVNNFDLLQKDLMRCESKDVSTELNKGSKMDCYLGETIFNLYSCRLKELLMPRDNDPVDKVIITHVVGKKIDDIQLLKITDSKTNNIRFNLLFQFPNLETLIITKCEWKGLKHVYGTRQLTKLFINGNDIEDLPEASFEGIPRLRTINLRHNNIKSIDKNAFSYLSKLHFLDLSDNQIETLEKDLFSESIHLTKLSLAQNKIKSVSMELFDNHKKLLMVNFNQNEIHILIKGSDIREFYHIMDMTQNSCANELFDRKATQIANSKEKLPKCYLNTGSKTAGITASAKGARGGT